MNRIIGIVFALTLSLFLTGCGKKSEEAATGAAPVASEQAAPAAASSLDDLYQQANNARDKGEQQKSFELFTQADAQGSDCASFFIGMAYENGEGRPADMAKAMEWYQKSSTAGCVEATKRIKLLKGKK